MSTSNWALDEMELLRELEGIHLVAIRTDLPAAWAEYRAARDAVDRLMGGDRIQADREARATASAFAEAA